MFGNAAFLTVFLIICPFLNEDFILGSAEFSNDPGSVSAALVDDWKYAGSCLILRDKPILDLKVAGKIYSVALKPHDSILNPFKPVRVFNGFNFDTAVKAFDFVPCLVHGTTEKDGHRVNVYGNISNGTFNGFAILDTGVSHIREAGLHRVKRQLRALEASGHSSFFASGFRMGELENANVTSTPGMHDQHPPVNQYSAKEKGGLHDKDCALKLMADHTFHRDVGAGDIGLSLSFMTYYVQEVDRVFREVDLDGSGVPSQIGFRVKDMIVFEDHSSPGQYWLHDTTLTSGQLLVKLATMKDDKFCYNLLFTSRRFLENSLGKSYTWNPNAGDNSTGGICAADDANGRLPNVGFVSLRLGRQKLPPRVSTLAVARVLGMAFGCRVKASSTVCQMAPNKTNIMDSYFPPPSNLWNTINPGFSSCSVDDMKPVVSSRSQCFIPVLPHVDDLAEEYQYYSVSAACMNAVLGHWFSISFPVIFLLLVSALKVFLY